MGSEWPIAKLGDYCTKIGSGSTPRGGSKVYLDEGDICLIRSQNVYNEGFKSEGLVYITEDAAEKLKNVVVEENDVLLNITGDSVARVCLAKNEYLPARVNQHVAIIRPNPEEFDPRYIRYLLASPYMQELLLTMASSGATRNALTKGMIEVLEIPKPAIDVQRRIADHLSVLDDKIELNTQTNQTLEQIAQAIFKSWFVDFDPVRAKMAVLEAGGTPEAAERAAMRAISAKDDAALEQMQRETPEAYARLEQTVALFPSAMEDSELGEIPEGWSSKPFGELLEKTIGGDWGKEEPDSKHTQQVKILRGTDLPNVRMGNDGSVPTRYVEEKKLKTRRLQDSDIVIEVSGGSPQQPTGRSLYITDQILDRLDGVVEPASFCRMFRPVSREIGLLLSVHLTHIYDEGKTWLYQNQSTGISNFQTKVFLEKEYVVYPGEEVIKQFFTTVRPIIDKITHSESKSLAEIRDNLLPKFLSGEIDVSHIQTEANEVTV